MKFSSSITRSLLTLGFLTASFQQTYGEEPQTRLSEIASVPFGSSLEQTVQTLNTYAISKRLKLTVPPADQKGNQFVALGGEFAGEKVDVWVFNFAQNKLYNVTIGFETKDTIVTLDAVAALITKKYGPATTAVRSYTFPYNVPFRTLDQASIEDAFKKKKASFNSVWKLLNGRIKCEVEFMEGSGLVTTLVYSHDEFAKHREEDKKSGL